MFLLCSTFVVGRCDGVMVCALFMQTVSYDQDGDDLPDLDEIEAEQDGALCGGAWCDVWCGPKPKEYKQLF